MERRKKGSSEFPPHPTPNSQTQRSSPGSGQSSNRRLELCLSQQSQSQWGLPITRPPLSGNGVRLILQDDLPSPQHCEILFWDSFPSLAGIRLQPFPSPSRRLLEEIPVPRTALFHSPIAKGGERSVSLEYSDSFQA